MKSANHTWQKAAVFICTKCQKAIDPASLSISGDVAEHLKNKLKSELRDAGKGKEIRVMTSSCLSICIDDLQAITIFPSDGQGKQIESIVFHPEKDYNQLFDKLKNY